MEENKNELTLKVGLELDKLEKDKPNIYLGDVKWVLYQYICDLEKVKLNGFTFRCGNYAYDKLSNMSGFEYFDTNYKDRATLNLNGEYIVVYKAEKLPKKQITITPRHIDEFEDFYKACKNDLTLLFA
jgi:hypothetical protein